jgi:hypothetical protein
MDLKTPAELRRSAREIIAACEFVTDLPRLVALPSLAVSHGERATYLERNAKARLPRLEAWQARSV